MYLIPRVLLPFSIMETARMENGEHPSFSFGTSSSGSWIGRPDGRILRRDIGRAWWWRRDTSATGRPIQGGPDGDETTRSNAVFQKMSDYRLDMRTGLPTILPALTPVLFCDMEIRVW